jgi:hypothetical protein
MPHKLTAAQLSEATERYLAGESVPDLAKAFGVHRATMVRRLRDSGVEIRFRVVSDDDLDEARRLYESGLSLATVGERFGVAAWTMLSVFRRAGVPTRPPGTNQWH